MGIDNIVICDVVRTPFGHGNKLKNIPQEKMLALIFKELVKRNNLSVKDLSGVIAGAVHQNTKVPNIARIASVLAGFPEELADFSVQANCNTGFTALLSAVGMINIGIGDLYITAGVENMSDFGFRLNDETSKYGSVEELEQLMKDNPNEFLNNFRIVNCLEEGLTDSNNNISMIEIAEVMANCFDISRREQDEYTRMNLERALNALNENYLSDYIMSIDEIDKDTYPLNRKRMLKRDDSFSRADPVFGENSPLLTPDNFFKKHKEEMEKLGISNIKPTVSMYNSSIPGNGGGACIVTTEHKAKELGLKPKLRLISWSMEGVNPIIMGIGPLYSTKKMFSNPKSIHAQNISFDHLDIIEIHEAFASQVLSVYKESLDKFNLKWDMSKTNIYGGSLAYTHPLAATNYRLLANVFSRMDNNPQAKTALACGCAGGGLGTSVLFSRY